MSNEVVPPILQGAHLSLTAMLALSNLLLFEPGFAGFVDSWNLGRCNISFVSNSTADFVKELICILVSLKGLSAKLLVLVSEQYLPFCRMVVVLDSSKSFPSIIYIKLQLASLFSYVPRTDRLLA